MKINIEGDINNEDLIKIGTFLKDLFHNRDEHINVFISEGTEKMSSDEVAEMLSKMFGDTVHSTFIKQLFKHDDGNGTRAGDKKET